MTTTVLVTCGIQPPPCAAAELTVPLSFFDILWLHFHPTRRLIFYEHPCSNAEFFETIIPKLKKSLSLTLKHYLLAAGNLLYPLDTENKPVFRYISGDSVSLTVAVSGRDFDDLTGNHARDSDQFYDFMPQTPPLIEEAEYKIVPLIALQVTLFSGRGICIGVSNHHCLGDARSIVGFMSAWASINKSGGDEEFLSENGDSLPFFDRPVSRDSGRIDDIYWNEMKRIPLNPPSSFPLPTKRVRASFTLRQYDVTKLKNLVVSENPSLVRVSSFVVTAAYVWSCMVKSGGEVAGGENEDEVFVFAADGRGRPNALFDPPVPVNYFGNCLGGVRVSVKRKDLAADGGILAAAEAIVDVMKKKIYNQEEFLSGFEKTVSNFRKYGNMRMFCVSGSPKFDLMNCDFGWGKAGKVEILSLDAVEYQMSFSNSGGDGGGLVVGMSLPKERMEAFSAIFADGLVKLV